MHRIMRDPIAMRYWSTPPHVETHRATGTWQVGDELCDSVYLRLPL